ncbi:hypothetical protein AAF712_015665 [Marasmius tenuissimus]|uniref:Uncharacterized protein n=1 Tax=Marasmius tenuissimus TaxID=585030 RepID=A0ABR2ZB47_9AGAR
MPSLSSSPQTDNAQDFIAQYRCQQEADLDLKGAPSPARPVSYLKNDSQDNGVVDAGEKLREMLASRADYPLSEELVLLLRHNEELVGKNNHLMEKNIQLTNENRELVDEYNELIDENDDLRAGIKMTARWIVSMKEALDTEVDSRSKSDIRDPPYLRGVAAAPEASANVDGNAIVGVGGKRAMDKDELNKAESPGAKRRKLGVENARGRVED